MNGRPPPRTQHPRAMMKDEGGDDGQNQEPTNVSFPRNARMRINAGLERA